MIFNQACWHPPWFCWRKEEPGLDAELCSDVTEGIRFFISAGGGLPASDRRSPRAGSVPTCLLWCRKPVKAEGSLRTPGDPSPSAGPTDENGVIKRRGRIGRSKKSTERSCLALMLIISNEVSAAERGFTLPRLYAAEALLCSTVRAAGKSQDRVFFGWGGD